MMLEKAILGRKLGMTQMFLEDGTAAAATLVQAGPCFVMQKKSKEKEGYHAVQLGFEDLPEKKANRPMKGHAARAQVGPKRVLREFVLAEGDSLQLGQEIKVDVFESGESVDVSGISKGRGFAGVFKRYGFHGGGASHGSMLHRRPASGGATDPARVFKGTRKPGHMGSVRTTMKGLKVLQVDAEKGLLVSEGGVPGASGGLLEITKPMGRDQEAKD